MDKIENQFEKKNNNQQNWNAKMLKHICMYIAEFPYHSHKKKKIFFQLIQSPCDKTVQLQLGLCGNTSWMCENVNWNFNSCVAVFRREIYILQVLFFHKLHGQLDAQRYVNFQGYSLCHFLQLLWPFITITLLAIFWWSYFILLLKLLVPETFIIIIGSGSKCI